MQLLDHKVYEKLLVIISQEREILQLYPRGSGEVSSGNKRIHFATSHGDISSVAHLPPTTNRRRALLVGLNFFFLSFFFIAAYPLIYLGIYISQRFQFSFSSTFVRSVESIFSFQLFLQHPPTTLPDRENLRAILSLSLSGCNVLVDDFKGETFSMRIVF